MVFNKNLIIVIPTYNRVKILKIWLEHHAQLMFLMGIRIHVQNNCSTDTTVKLLTQWKKKFKNISFESNNTNIGPIRNFEKLLNKFNCKFVWLIGDTYLINNQLIDKIISKIKKHSPLFFIINLNDRIKILNDSYLRSNFVLENISGVLSCTACVIYNKAKLKKIRFKKKPISYFAHTLYILDQLKTNNLSAYWISLSIYNLPNKIKKNWSNTSLVFEIGCKNWVDTINQLRHYSLGSKQKAFMLFSKITNLFNWKSGLWLRAQGLLTINNIRTYKIYLNKSVGKSYILLYLIALIPIYPLKILKKIYDQCLKK
jgi:hypothetical protein